MHFTERHPEIRRVGSQKFVYTKTRKPVPESICETIRSLRIPKDYHTLWVSPNPEQDSLQAIALDSQGRKQYFYSADWIYYRNAEKIKRMYKFALRLPRLEQRMMHDICSLPTFHKYRVIAFMLRIVQLTNIRIGNKKYYDRYKSHGLCTLQKHQVRLGRHVAFINFIGKHHQEHDIVIREESVVNFLKNLLRINSTTDENWLFVFQQDNNTNQFFQVSAQMVNDYLHLDPELAEITCKDFRTLNANIVFLKLLRDKPIDTTNDSKLLARNVRQTIEDTSRHLNNSANVCKQSYIMDVVVDMYMNDPGFVQRKFIIDILKQAVKKAGKKK